MTSFPAANDAPQDVVMMAPLDGDALHDVAQSGDSRHDDARNADVLVDRAPNDAVLNGEPEDGGPLDTVVIGAGHAGLTMAYYLQRMGQRFVVLDRNPRVGDSWRQRWDSLRLFSTPRYASLPGWRMRTDGNGFPTRDEMADYLQAYAERFRLPVRSGVRVTGLTRENRSGDGFLVTTDAGLLHARQVVVAAGGHRVPVAPAFAVDLDPSIRQLHSTQYRNPSQLGPGPLLVVGAGNSGTDIAREAVATHQVWLAGRDPGEVPIRVDSARARLVIPIAMFAFRHLLTIRTPMGRAARPDVLAHGATVVRNKREYLRAAGVVLTGPIAEVRDGLPVTAQGDVLPASTVRGAQVLGRITVGSGCRRSATTAAPCTTAVWSMSCRDCTSSAWISSSRRPPERSRECRRTPGTSRGGSAGGPAPSHWRPLQRKPSTRCEAGEPVVTASSSTAFLVS